VAFDHNCVACHDAYGEGTAGPRRVGIRQKFACSATLNGFNNPSAKMPGPFPPTLNEQNVRDDAAHVRQF
jgi:hypothetical protein